MKNIKAFFICVYNFQHIFDFVKLVTLKYFLPKWTITVNQKTKTEILFTDYIYRYQNSSKKHLNKLLRHWNECTTLPDRRRLIMIIFLLLSKALFQTYLKYCRHPGMGTWNAASRPALIKLSILRTIYSSTNNFYHCHFNYITCNM